MIVKIKTKDNGWWIIGNVFKVHQSGGEVAIDKDGKLCGSRYWFNPDKGYFYQDANNTEPVEMGFDYGCEYAHCEVDQGLEAGSDGDYLLRHLYIEQGKEGPGIYALVNTKVYLCGDDGKTIERLN